MDTAVAERRAERGKELPWSWRGAILAVVLVEFVLAHGLPWQTTFDWDRPIWWTYAVIPVLVFAALAVRRELGFVSWFLHSLEIMAAKFWITASLLLALLIAREDRPRVDPSPFPRPVVSAPVAAGGAAAEDAEAPVTAFVLGGGVVHPPFAVVRAGDRIGVASTDGTLHAARLRRADGSSLANVAVRVSGQAVLTVDEAAGEWLTLDCAIHGGPEGGARIFVLP